MLSFLKRLEPTRVLMNSTNSQPVCRVAIVGAGLIGSGWAAHFLACGVDVVATDPAPGAEEALRRQVDRVWPILVELGLRSGADRTRLKFIARLEDTVADADFIQESGPERIELKSALFIRLDAAVPAGVLIASSSSGLTMTAIQAGCRHPERCVIGHPFNPPYLVPLVEVVGGQRTSEESLTRAMEIYAHFGKHPIRLRREIAGHVANRLQAALWRETLHLVAEGVVSVADVDTAVSSGPGLRWGVMGPNLIFHMGGGQGGIRHFLDHLAAPFSRWWDDLGQPRLTPELRAKLIAGIAEETGSRSIDELERDRLLAGVLAVKQAAPGAKPA